MVKIYKPHTLHTMPGATTARLPRSGDDITCVLRTQFNALLAAAAVALVFATLTPVSGESSTLFVEGLPSTPKTNSNTTDGIICWETQGLHESDCFHAENLTTETYPLTQEMLERASSRYTTTGLSLNRAFQRARKRGVLKVVVVGGSVTYGHECVSPAGLKGVECAWPHRLQQWFDERVEDVPVEVRQRMKKPRC